MSKEEVLRDCTVEGLIVKLPDVQLERKLYQDVAKSLQLIGGKWKGGKVMGFVFQEDPTELLEQISNGEKKNLKKEFQFFATPDDVADWLVQLAELDSDYTVLEPSAGQGAIVKAIWRYNEANENIITGNGKQTVYCYELMDINRTILEKLVGANFIKGNDFLTEEILYKYPRIIANPPFAKNQDIDHIRRMYSCLEDGGKLVSIASKHWQLSNNKKEREFREWLDEVNAEIFDIPAGKFKESGTNISTSIIIINK